MSFHVWGIILLIIVAAAVIATSVVVGTATTKPYKAVTLPSKIKSGGLYVRDDVFIVAGQTE